MAPPASSIISTTAPLGVTTLQGDTNGDRVADFAIDLTGNVALTYNDVIGVVLTVTVIEAFGTTVLKQVGSQFYLKDPGGSGPSLKYGGADYVATPGGWAPIGAEQTSSGYEVAWKLTNADQYFFWNVDASGNYVSAMGSILSGSSSSVQSIETSFRQDLNGDEIIGLVPVVSSVIEAYGSTTLLKAGNTFFLTDGNGSGPSLKYGAADYVATPGGWVPIGAEQTSSGYEVAWKLTNADQYFFWNVDTNGNYISAVGSILNGSSSSVESLETGFHQDLNGDEIIGLPPLVTTVVEAYGSTTLLKAGNNFFLADGHGSGPSLKYGGADYVATPGGWAPIGAEQTSSGYEVAWKLAGTDQYFFWNTDGTGNYVSAMSGVVSGSSATLEALEISFHQDLNGDGTTGFTPVAASVIEAFGSTTLVKVGSSFYLDDTNGSGPSLKSGSIDYVATPGGWTPIGAEQAGSGYEIAWKLTGADQYFFWNTDGNGNYVSAMSNIVTGTSATTKSLELSFHQDLNGDGTIGVAMASINEAQLKSTQAFTDPDVNLMVGTAGSDSFIFKPNFGKTTIVNFTPGEDTLGFDHTLFGSVASVVSHMMDDGHGNVVIVAEVQDVVTLKNTTTAALQQHLADFHIV